MRKTPNLKLFTMAIHDLHNREFSVVVFEMYDNTNDYIKSAVVEKSKYFNLNPEKSSFPSNAFDKQFKQYDRAAVCDTTIIIKKFKNFDEQFKMPAF